MKAFLDTNVLLDLLMKSRLGHEATTTILQVVRSGDISACMTTQSVIDAAYIQTQRCKSPVTAFKEAIRLIGNIVELLPILPEDIEWANRSTIDDYEDAARLSCAQRSGCDVIVTSDKKYKNYTDIAIYDPFELYSLLFSRPGQSEMG